MTLQQLNYVITITETGSINKAAEKLFVSQPSLTNAVKELEKETGLTLFNRGGRGVTLTGEGEEFLLYARQVYQQYTALQEKYTKGENDKKRFCVSTQHYSFAVKAFVETVKKCDAGKYDLAVRETTTRNVINDVSTLRSEIGILYLSDINRKVMTKLFKQNELEFFKLIICKAYVYIWRGHPLANKKSIKFSELEDFPCLSFEQDGNNVYCFAEEILSTNEYMRAIKASDRATILNLMVGLNGYVICPGIICEELNGDDYVAIPYEGDEENPNLAMEFGYIVKKNSILSKMGERYIREIRNYLHEHAMEEDIPVGDDSKKSRMA